MHKVGRECPKCGSLFMKSLICSFCGTETKDLTQKDEPKMNLQKCATGSDCDSIDAHKAETRRGK